MDEIICFEPGIAKREGGASRFVNDKSVTLRANMGDNQPAVVYGIDAVSSNSWKSSNPHSGVHEMEVCKCLDTTCLNPQCNQGGGTSCIALEGNGTRPSHFGNGWNEDGKMYTLNTIERHSVCYGISRSALMGGDGSNGGMPVEKNIQPTMTANGCGAVCYDAHGIQEEQ